MVGVDACRDEAQMVHLVAHRDRSDEERVGYTMSQLILTVAEHSIAVTVDTAVQIQQPDSLTSTRAMNRSRTSNVIGLPVAGAGEVGVVVALRAVAAQVGEGAVRR